MITRDKIPAEWRVILDEIQVQCPAVIAGGALRDLDHDIPVKDLDIFIGAGDLDEAAGLNELLGGKQITNLDAQAYPDGISELILVSELEKDIGLPVQLIFCNWNVADIWKRFDYTLCQIMFNGLEVIVSDEYIEDRSQKVFRLIRCDTENALRSSILRFNRWKIRYPEHDWRLGCHLNVGVNQGDFSLTHG